MIQEMQEHVEPQEQFDAELSPTPIDMQTALVVESVTPFQIGCGISLEERSEYISLLKALGDPTSDGDESEGDESVSHTSSDSSLSGTEDDAFALNQCEQWTARYQELAKYKKTYGNCHVPYDWVPNKGLSQWVKRQRHQRRLREDGKHSNMTEEREKMLSKLGFIWDSRAANWEERLNELIQFKEQYGHCKVTTKYTAHRPLAVWLKRQRHAVREFLKGKPDARISQDRVSRLFEVGVKMNIQRSK